MAAFSALIAVAGATVIVAGAVVWILHPWRGGAAAAEPRSDAEEPAPTAAMPKGMEAPALIPAPAR